MKVFNCILGILTVLASIYCIFYPGLTFLNVGWIVTIILGLWGISTIISYAVSRNDGNNKEKALMGTLGLIAGIAAAVVSALAMFMPGIRVMFDILILAIFAVWLIVDGISSIATSFKVKKSGSSVWVLPLICGVLVLLAGIYGIFNLIFTAQTLGLFMGILLMTYGIRLILSAFKN